MRNHRLFISTIRIFGFALIAVALSACARQASVGHQGKTAIPESLKKKILADAKEDIRGIEKVAEDPAGFSRYLDGQALEDMSKEVSLNNKKGRVKVRRYENIKLDLNYYAKGVAGMAFDFDDGSYYTQHGDTGKRSLAIADKRRLALALAKRGGQWKIISILQPASDPAQ